MVELESTAAYSWSVDRFVRSRLRSLVPALDQRRLLQLCQGFDRLSDQRLSHSSLGLEIDHRSCGTVDCYLSGSEEIFGLLRSGFSPQISERFRHWLLPIYHLEYDYFDSGYVFAGFSQRCGLERASVSEILLVVEDFIARQVAPAAVSALARSGVTALIAQLGGPVHLAVMPGRHRHWLKLVLPLNSGNLKCLLAQLVDGLFAQRLGHLLDAWPLFETSVALLPEQACKLSLDLDLSSAVVSERIGLELSIPRRDAARASRQVELLKRLMEPVSASLQGYQQMLALQASIPYGERHSATPEVALSGLVDGPLEQLFVVTSSHVKVCLLPCSKWVKSYIGLCRLLLPHPASW